MGFMDGLLQCEIESLQCFVQCIHFYPLYFDGSFHVVNGVDRLAKL
jgi:hypothetical protein